MKNKATKKYELTEEIIAVGIIHTDLPFHLATDEHDVKYLAETWTDNKCEAIYISYRDGMYFVIEGQKRTLAAKMRFGTDKKLKCFVRRDCLTIEDDAEWFYELNHQKRKFSESVEGYLSRQYFDSDWKKVIECVANSGLSISYGGSKSDCSISCLTTLETIFDDFTDKDDFQNMLTLLYKSICGAKESLMATFLKGFAVFYKSYSDDLDETKLHNCFVLKQNKKELIDVSVFSKILDDTDKYKSDYSKIGKASAQAIRGVYNRAVRNKDKQLKLSPLEDVVTFL